MKIDEAEKYFLGRVKELSNMCSDGTPWVFPCGSTLIEYLSKLATGKNEGGQGFIDFVIEYMPDGYKNFQYASGDDDLPIQAYSNGIGG